MKKYVSLAVKWLAVLAAGCALALLMGVALVLTQGSARTAGMALIGIGGPMGILFFTCYFAERGRMLTIHGDTVIFPRGAERDGKIVFRKTAVRLSDIDSVKSVLRKGDRIFSQDCYFHTICLKNGTQITVTLYSYGPEAEREIIDLLQNT